MANRRDMSHPKRHVVCLLPSFQLQKDANLQVFKPIPEGKTKKDANLQEFPAILVKRASFVKNSCRFAGIWKF